MRFFPQTDRPSKVDVEAPPPGAKKGLYRAQITHLKFAVHVTNTLFSDPIVKLNSKRLSMIPKQGEIEFR